MDLDRLLAAEAAVVEAALDARLPVTRGRATRLVDAMRYSLLGGGKRLRPVLCLWIHDAAAQTPRTEAVLDAACALEMLHSYSLVHDDLPAMDDDDLRRGQPSCHRQFDEATAILAGDALQTEAFARLAAIEPPALALRLIRLLADAAGPEGMAAGQQLDLDATGGAGNLLDIHRLKTGRLLGAAAAMGAACAGCDEATVDAVRAGGEDVGVAFQMVDDVLDVTVDTAQLGKSAGKDATQGKVTAVEQLGIEGAWRDARAHLDRALRTWDAAGVLDERVRALATRLVERSR